MTPQEIAALVTAGLAVTAAVGRGGWKMYTAHQAAKADRAAQLREERDDADDEYRRVRKRLDEVVPTVDATTNRYLEISAKVIELMHQLTEVNAAKAETEAAAAQERRLILAAMGGNIMQLNDLRRHFEDTTGLTLAPIHDPMGLIPEALAEAARAGYAPPPLPRPGAGS